VKVERAEPRSIAVVGAGVAGCALVAQLRRLGCRAPITLLEIGRGAGGRASTRRSRRDPALAIDHGAPLFNLSAGPPASLLAPLLQGGWIESWPPDSVGLALLEADGQIRMLGQISDASQAGLLEGGIYRGTRGMESLSGGLLALAAAATPADLAEPNVRYGVLVRELVASPGGPWHLLDGQGQLLAQADWLVLAGTLLAHPRGKQVFGWPEVPLAAAARQLDDPELDGALAALAMLESEARSNLLMVITAAAAQAWLALPFRYLGFSEAAQRRWGLERLSLQPLADGRLVVVAHSTAEVAARNLGVHGSCSSAGRLLAAPADPLAESGLIQALSESLADCLAKVLPAGQVLEGLEQRQLMRWGAAFPTGSGLDAESMVCATSRIALCGDFIAGAGFGRIEGALRSGEWLAGRLLPLLALLLLLLIPSPGWAADPALAAAPTVQQQASYDCDGAPLIAFYDNGAVDAPAIPNTSAGTVPGAVVVLRWRDLSLQLPRTNRAGPPSYTDGRWWWSLEDPLQPRFLEWRGSAISHECFKRP